MRNRRHAPVFFRSAAPPLLNALPPARIAGFFTTPCCFFHLSHLYIYSCKAAYYLFYPASLRTVFAIRIQYYTVSSTLSSLAPFRFSLLPRQSCVKRLSARRLCITFLSAGMRIRPCGISSAHLCWLFLHQKTACPVWGTRFCAISFNFAWMGCRGSSSPRIPRHTCSAPRSYPGPRALSKTALPLQTRCS